MAASPDRTGEGAGGTGEHRTPANAKITGLSQGPRVLSQAGVFVCHFEIKMTTSCHGKQAAETGSANGK